MDTLQKLSAMVSCQQAVHSFYLALDASDFEKVCACFAPAGVWHRQGVALHGPHEVADALAKRPLGRTTAHLVQNLVVEFETPVHASVRYMTLVYRVDVDAANAGPAELDLPLSISVNNDRFELTEGGRWLLTEKRSSRKFGA